LRSDDGSRIIGEVGCGVGRHGWMRCGMMKGNAEIREILNLGKIR
jgi:hypothetical protein